MNKQGQGLSLSVIIIAALALIVLVVLVAIFVGKIGDTDTKLTTEGDSKLNEYKSLSYGDCHPGSAAEIAFLTSSKTAESPEEKDEAEADFESAIAECNSGSISKDECDAIDGCKWR